MSDTEQSPSPELIDLFDSMKKEVDKEIESLQIKLDNLVKIHHAQVSTHLQKVVGPTIQAPTSLPWFKYGIRGFLSKLWYGDHPDNPSWQNNQQECLSLDYFAYLGEELKIATNTIFLETGEIAGQQLPSEEVPIDIALAGQLDRMLKEFHGKILLIVAGYMRKAMALKPASQSPSGEPISQSTHSIPASQSPLDRKSVV